MTVASTDTPRAADRPSFIARLGAVFDAYAKARSRRDRIGALTALSDEDLTERGLTRDGIVAHVFADKLYL